MKTYFLAFLFGVAVLRGYCLKPRLNFPKYFLRVLLPAFLKMRPGRVLKEALTQGVANAVLNLNKTDGFFGSQVYKMFLPPDAQKIEKTLRSAGMGFPG
jgi:hypothetical protein